MRYLFLICLLALTACSTTPTNPPFPKPEAPKVSLAYAAANKSAVSFGSIGDEFVVHKDIIKDLSQFSLKYRGKNLLSNLGFDRQTQVTIEFRSFNLLDYRGMRTIVRLYDNLDYVDFWVYLTYGHTNDTNPNYPQEREDVILTNGDQVTTINLAAPNLGLRVGHGQGLPIKFFRYYFASDIYAENEWVQPIAPQTFTTMPPWFTKPALPKWILNTDIAGFQDRRNMDKTYMPFQQTQYIYVYPPQTGSQNYQGCYHTLPEIYSGWIAPHLWRKQLYMEGCRPGNFIHSDGKLVTDVQKPNLVYSGNWFHEHSRGYGTETWIVHTSPKNPWHDKMAYDPVSGSQWTGYDSQHWGIGPITQVYQLTNDLGLALIIEHTAERWLFQNPSVQKGTTHHHAGAARTQGRRIEAGCSLYHAHRDPVVKARLKKRIKELLWIQIEAWDARVAEYGKGWVPRKDGYSVWEHGLWIKGLATVRAVIQDDALLRDKIYDLFISVSRWVLKGFKQWGDHWSIPYTIAYDELTWSKNPSDGLAEWCLPSIQLLDKFGRQDLTAAEETKLTAILKQFIDDHVVKQTPNKWDSRSIWRLF